MSDNPLYLIPILDNTLTDMVDVLNLLSKVYSAQLIRNDAGEVETIVVSIKPVGSIEPVVIRLACLIDQSEVQNMDPTDAPRGESVADNGYGYEALDRIHCSVQNLNANVTTHPFVQGNPQVKELIEQAEKCLADAYQLVGNLVH